jgi:hypothetical protein
MESMMADGSRLRNAPPFGRYRILDVQCLVSGPHCAYALRDGVLDELA